MKYAIVVLLAGCLQVEAFVPSVKAPVAGRPCRAITSVSAENSDYGETRGAVLRKVAAISTGLLGASLPVILPAEADVNLTAVKKSYFRYVPRILEAAEWFKGDLKKAVKNEDWAQVSTYFEVVNTAKADSQRPSMYQSTSNKMERELYSPLVIWSQSFASKGTGKKITALQDQEAALEAAMSTLSSIASNEYSLSGGETQGKVAMASWEAGRDALKAFVDIANTGMTRQLNKVDLGL